MAIPVVSTFTVFDNIAATTTTELHTISGQHASRYAASILLEVVGASTPNWTLDIQGKVHPSGTYANLDYFEIWQGTPQGLSSAQKTVNDTTRRFYLVPNPPQFVQIIATRTAGTPTR